MNEYTVLSYKPSKHENQLLSLNSSVQIFVTRTIQYIKIVFNYCAAYASFICVQASHGYMQQILPKMCIRHGLLYACARVNRYNQEKVAMAKCGVVCKIGPSVLNADLTDLHHESQRLLDSGADYLHLDVMDGHFVPNITFGHPVVKCLRNKITDAFFETHMMVVKPEQWIEPMADAGVDQYTFHVEPCIDVPFVCRKVKEAGMKVGLALKPGTGVQAVQQYIDQADMILVMTVEPGFGGQKFMKDMMGKVQWLRQNYPDLDIEVDGGVGLATIEACAEAGANMIVSGTAVIGAEDPGKVIATMRDVVEGSIQKCQLER